MDRSFPWLVAALVPAAVSRQSDRALWDEGRAAGQSARPARWPSSVVVSPANRNGSSEKPRQRVAGSRGASHGSQGDGFGAQPARPRRDRAGGGPIDWSRIDDERRFLEEVLATPYEQLFDPKYDTPVHLGITLDKGRAVPVTPGFLASDGRADDGRSDLDRFGDIDLAGVSRLGDLKAVLGASLETGSAPSWTSLAWGGGCAISSATTPVRQYSRQRRPLPTFEFRLFVAGPTPRSHAAEANLRALCEASVPDDHSIEVIDVLERPQAAEAERVLATPTVVRLAPLPRRRVIGDLSDPRLAAIALEIPEPEEKPDERGLWT